MLQYVSGDLFLSEAQTLVNPVNTVGVMGKGIALLFKNQYPDMFDSYKTLCKNGLLEIGKPCLWKSPEKQILLFPTKKHWRSASKIEYIESGLKYFVGTYEDWQITSVAFPMLGCGNGGLDWNDVKPLMEKYLKPLPINVRIYI